MDNEIKNVLVTGGNGFIGSHLVNELEAKGMNVTVFDRRDKIQWKSPKIKVITGDIRKSEDVKSAGAEADAVFHLAAHTKVMESIEDPINDMENNIVGTLNVLELARKRGIPVVYASSGAVYGNPQHIPMDENHPLKPLSPYGISKLTAEKYCHAYSDLYGIKTAATRFSNVFGPMNRKAVIYNFVSGVIKNKEITIYGSGEQKRDFVYVKDVVHGVLAALGKSGAYNISSGSGTTINQLADMLAELLGEFRINKEPGRKGEIEISTLDNKKATEKLGFSLKHPMKEALAETVEWAKTDLKE